MTTAHYNIHAYFSNGPSNNHNYVLTADGTFEDWSKLDGAEFETEAEAMGEFEQIDAARLEQEWKGFQIIKISVEKTTVDENDEIQTATVAEKEVTIDAA